MAFSGQGDPLAVETVVVPNPGMGKWLSLEIAEVCAFCPQIEFVRPGRFLYQYIFNPMTGRTGATDESTFIPEVTQWQIYDWLESCTAERVTAFIHGDALRRWQLACRLARLFDQYMTTRQDMLEKWESGQWSVVRKPPRPLGTPPQEGNYCPLMNNGRRSCGARW
jgi:exodeoxyribonuclease V gamma subunit